MVEQNHDDEGLNDDRASGHWWVGLLAGLLIGGLAGAVAMLLLAPQSGQRTRAKLRREGAMLREQTADTVEDAVTQARVKTGQITQDVHRQAEGLQQRGHAMLDGQ
jgi:gas vesicle protein